MSNIVVVAGGKLSQPEMAKFSRYVRNEVNRQLYLKLQSIRPYLEITIYQEVKKMLAASSEVHDLINGKLRLDFGLMQSEAASAVIKIGEIIARDISIQFIQEPDGIRFYVNLLRDNYAEILALPEASFIQTYSRRPGSSIDWLEWLLLRGDEIIIADYRVMYKQTDSSRSGGAIMIKANNFRVPPQFSGVADNNFITRALQGIEKILFEEIIRAIS